jgi:hypothetical protein
MNRLLVIIATVCALLAFSFSAVVADNNFPSQGPAAKQPSKPALSHSQQQQLYYGYVPPPPIRHTWPGGYRVILHEMTNTLMDHITGHY